MDVSILTVLAILAATVLLLVFEMVRIDVVAILCMLALGWSGVLTPQEAISGFSSNAVVAMMAVMILGQGIARTGLMDRFSRGVIDLVGSSRSKIVALVSLSAAAVSGLIQNIGSAALFLPGVLDISRREQIPASRLIMPIGFTTILGGTLSMVGSGPLILLNDLLRNAGLSPYNLFAVTPVGVLLVVTGIVYFLLLGRFLLPGREGEGKRVSAQEKLIQDLHLPHRIWHFTVPPGSPLVGKTTEESGIWGDSHLNVLGISMDKEVEYAPWRGRRFEAGHVLALLGEEERAKEFASRYRLEHEEKAARFENLRDPDRAGFAEAIIPPRSEMAGQTIRRYALRKRYAVEPVMVFSGGKEIRGDFSDHAVSAGDTFIVYGPWENIEELKKSPDFVVVTPFEAEKKTPSMTLPAIGCFVLAVGLAFSGFPISISFFTGAVGMILVRVLSIQEAYRAIEWKVVFLLAGLIPLGTAMEKTGTAAWLAERVMTPVQGSHPVLILVVVATLSTIFSLFMSNVGAIVVLAPLVMNMGSIAEMDPRALALLAAVCTANSFILPTHQVNAMLMSSGGYRNIDYIRAGSGLTLIFITVAVAAFYFFYL